MSRYIRSNTPGATYFFTVSLYDRSARDLVDHIDILRASLQATKAVRPFRIDAMVVLPEHLHALWTLPGGDADYGLRWRLIKRGFTRALAVRRELEGGALPRRGADERVLWQRRFWEHQIRGEEDFARHVDYIHFNPVKHGWVTMARDWPHSSFHRYVRQGRLPADWGVAASVAATTFGE